MMNDYIYKMQSVVQLEYSSSVISPMNFKQESTTMEKTLLIFKTFNLIKDWLTIDLIGCHVLFMSFHVIFYFFYFCDCKDCLFSSFW